MIVVFNPDEFREAYPQFSGMTDAQLENLFLVATTFIDNTEASPFPYDPPKDLKRKIMLNLFVCHLATMQSWQPGQTGAVASASQGSVSVSFAQPQMNRGWFSQTACGQTLWMMLAPYVIGGHIVAVSDFHPYG